MSTVIYMYMYLPSYVDSFDPDLHTMFSYSPEKQQRMRLSPSIAGFTGFSRSVVRCV
jgi:hypothetical protein